IEPDVAMTLDIGGNLAVSGTGRFLSSGAAHVTTVQLGAIFDGASSTNDLSTGRLRVGGHLVQGATNSPSSLHTSRAYIVELTGDGALSFATPDQSSVGNLVVATDGITRLLTSNVTVQDRLDLGGTGLVLETP